MKGVWFALLLSAWSAQTFAQSGRMLGRVLDENNNPLPAVTIYVANNAFAQAAITNVRGYFTLLSLPVGRYTVKALKRGLPLWEKQVTVSPATLRLDINLRQSPVEFAAKQDKTKPLPKPKAVSKTKTEKSESPKAEDLETAQSKATEPTTPVSADKEPDAKEEAETKTVSDEDIAKDEGLAQSFQDAKAVEASDLAKVDAKPEIVGGIETINRKIIYPEAARAKNLQGGVVARVSVDLNGNPTKVVVLKSTDPMFSEEVFRVLSEDVKFKPATLNGKPVASAAVIYVEFKLD